MTDDRPCAVCNRKAGDMLGESHCLGCHHDDLLAACKAMLALVKVCSIHYQSNDEREAILQATVAIAQAEETTTTPSSGG